SVCAHSLSALRAGWRLHLLSLTMRTVQLVIHSVGERLPTRLDNVVRNAHRAPALVIIPALDQHSDLRCSGLIRIQHSNLVVDQLNFFETLERRAQALSERPIERVNRPAPLGSRLPNLTVERNSHPGFRFQNSGRLTPGGNVIALQAEELVIASRCLLEQKAERSVGRLELKPVVFQLLDTINHRLQRAVAARDVDPHLRSLVQNVALTGKVGHQHATAVTGQLRLDVLVRQWIAHYRANVDAALVGKGTLADKRQ